MRLSSIPKRSPCNHLSQFVCLSLLLLNVTFRYRALHEAGAFVGFDLIGAHRV